MNVFLVRYMLFINTEDTKYLDVQFILNAQKVSQNFTKLNSEKFNLPNLIHDTIISRKRNIR